MARITMEEQPEFVVFPKETLLRLKVEETKLKDVNGDRGQWTKIEFKFKVLEVLRPGDGSNPAAYNEMIGKEIWGSVPWRLTDNPENKLRIWTEALLKVPLQVGFDLDDQMFAGRIVKAITGQYAGRATNPQTGQPFMRHQVDTLLADEQNPGLGAPVGLGQPVSQPGWGGQPAQPQQPQWSQPPAATATNGTANGWNAPGVSPAAPAQQPQPVGAQANGTQQWVPQQNLQQEQAPQQAPQSFAQQQIQAYTQPAEQKAPDPWAPPQDPSQPDF